MKYILETLREINNRFCGSHYVIDSDVEKANEYVELIEGSRSKTEPKIGDIIQYTNEYGDYYSSAHIDKVYEDGNVNVCEQPYVPFIDSNANNNGICCSTSGGAWCDLPTDKLVYVGKRQKRFCDWGNCGACADGAIEFEAEVSVWEYTSENNKFVSENGYPFTTKDFDRVYVSFNPNRKDTNYIYFADKNGCSFKAWENKEDFQAWLRTNRAEVFKGFWDNQYVVWIWKNIEHHVSPTEFDSLDLPEDTFLMNGAIRRCKRKYDEGTHTIHTYYVWYWNDPNKDFYEAATEQNEIREKLYTLDRRTPENQIAKRELATGKVKPIKL